MGNYGDGAVVHDVRDCMLTIAPLTPFHHSTAASLQSLHLVVLWSRACFLLVSSFLWYDSVCRRLVRFSSTWTRKRDTIVIWLWLPTLGTLPARSTGHLRDYGVPLLARSCS